MQQHFKCIECMSRCIITKVHRTCSPCIATVVMRMSFLPLVSCRISLASRWNGSLRISSSVVFWYFLISRKATVPGRYLREHAGSASVPCKCTVGHAAWCMLHGACCMLHGARDNRGTWQPAAPNAPFFLGCWSLVPSQRPLATRACPCRRLPTRGGATLALLCWVL